MSGAVPLFGDIMVNIFESSFEKVTFVKSKADSIFEKHFTDAIKSNAYCIKVATEKKNVINIGAATGHSLVLLRCIIFCCSN